MNQAKKEDRKKLCCDEGFGGIDARKLAKAFDGVFSNNVLAKYTYHEVLAKLEAYDREQSQIKVGDVVEYSAIKGVVGHIIGNKLSVICADGSSGYWTKSDCKKTGKYIDIQRILEEIGKEQLMRENDIIAEYVKNKYPELINSADFAFYKIAFACREFVVSFEESVKNIDFMELKKMVDEFNQKIGKE